MSAERRQSPRFAVQLDATVTPAGGKPMPCQVVDLSASGCRIRAAGAAQLWGPVVLTHRGRKLSAQVVWAKDGFAGLFFPPAAGQTDNGPMRRLWERLRGRG